MTEFLLIAKGHRTNWENISDKEWEAVMDQFSDWFESMKKTSAIVHSDRIKGTRVDLEKTGHSVQISEAPSGDAQELTGIFKFHAENKQQAIEYAKGCPSLLHDRLSLYELE